MLKTEIILTILIARIITIPTKMFIQKAKL